MIIGGQSNVTSGSLLQGPRLAERLMNATAVATTLLQLLAQRNASGSVCECGYGGCFDASSAAVWLGIQASQHAFPPLRSMPAMRLLDAAMQGFAHENSSCPGGSRLAATLDSPLSTFWEHDVGVLCLSSAAFMLRNGSNTDRYAFISVAEMLQDSYPTSPYTSTYAQNAVLLTDGTLAKNQSGLWVTDGCTANGTASIDCGVVWAEDSIVASLVLGLYARTFGDDDGGVGRAAADHASSLLLSACKRLAMPDSGLYAHGYNGATDTRSCCAPADSNGLLALAHVALIDTLRRGFKGHRALPPLTAALSRQAASLVGAQRSDGLWSQLLTPAVVAAGADRAEIVRRSVAVGADRAETTGSAFVCAALAAGAALGILDGHAAAAARTAFSALARLVGGAPTSLKGVMPIHDGYLLTGTLRSSPSEYLATPLGSEAIDVAVGALLLAAAAVSRLNPAD